MLCGTALIRFAVVLSLLAPGAAAGKDAMKEQFMMLDPATRIEQACAHEVQLHINDKEGDVHVDRIVTYSFSEPEVADKSVEAPGAAIRSHGGWYHLSFSCKTDETLVNVLQLDYVFGEAIPKSLWEDHLLHD